MEKYNPKKIESKWQKKWKEGKIFTHYDRKKKFYILDMFPYPSGAGLHVGHPKGFIATDVIARFKQLQGMSVLHPIGWDAFGLPAENYALKNKEHPRISTEKNIKYYKKQLENIGFTYDWDREINTTDPRYYKWTQWIFVQMFKKGLAYESYEPINWCPSCKTGLANEDLEDGRCERCDSAIEQKPLRQWVLKITDYADRMLEDLNKLDWPESIKESQRNWIGRSEGMVFTAPVKGLDLQIQTFSAHFEAFCADTFVVIAPDHKLLPQLLEGVENKDNILAFCKGLVDKKRSQKYGDDLEIEGIFTGRYISDPIGNSDLPIWVASYALANYGTGIVKCSAHDERDFAFAKKYNIPLKAVLFPEDLEERKKVENFEKCYFDMQNGILSEPKICDGKKGKECRKEIITYLKENNLAIERVSYKLQDWVFSRQRYWGEPIPIVHCKKCGPVTVPEAELPVVLPDIESYEPSGTGESPLANIPEWVNTKCPTCGGDGKRETNTMPQWAGSSWYYLRYIDPCNEDELVDKKKEKEWMPVSHYVGGAEHATRHLIYARFYHKFLYDNSVVSTDEPFQRLQNVGIILASDGRKMSKRWGNVINPDDVIDYFGADSLRLYEMFMGPFEQSIAWNTDGIAGVRRFLEKVWRLQEKNVEALLLGSISKKEKEIDILLHKTIKKVTEDIEEMRFNTAISTMMVLVNLLDKQEQINQEIYERLLIILSPFAPHITEELWEKMGKAESLFLQMWPQYDAKKVIDDEIELIIQINGKLRDKLIINADISEEEAKQKVFAQDRIKDLLNGKEIKKIIFVPGRLINIVVSN